MIANLSTLNRSSTRRCGFESRSGHRLDKPSSACGWSGGYSRGSLRFFLPHLTIESAQNEIMLAGRKTQIITRNSRDKNTNICIIGWSQGFV